MTKITQWINEHVDPEIIKKIKKSAIISLGGFLLTLIPLTVTELIASLQSLPYWWVGMAIAAFTSLSQFLIVFIQKWKANAELMAGKK